MDPILAPVTCFSQTTPYLHSLVFVFLTNNEMRCRHDKRLQEDYAQKVLMQGDTNHQLQTTKVHVGRVQAPQQKRKLGLVLSIFYVLIHEVASDKK